MRQGKMYNYIKTEYIPEVFTFMTLTFLETENGECAENGGDAEGLCKYDELNDYYNNSYYNDGLDMDQQDERFWNF